MPRTKISPNPVVLLVEQGVGARQHKLPGLSLGSPGERPVDLEDPRAGSESFLKRRARLSHQASASTKNNRPSPRAQKMRKIRARLAPPRGSATLPRGLQEVSRASLRAAASHRGLGASLASPEGNSQASSRQRTNHRSIPKTKAK